MENSKINIGDWVGLKNKSGAVIEGQSMTNTSLGKSSIIRLKVNDQDPPVTVNINFWTVVILHRNLITLQDVM